MYQRKTRDRYDIETNYGDGWETESSYDTFAEAKEDIEEYRLHMMHYGGAARIRKHREKIDQEA